MNDLEHAQEKVRFLEKEILEKDQQIDFLSIMLESIHELHKVAVENESEVFKFAKTISEKLFASSQLIIFGIGLEKIENKTHIKKVYTSDKKYDNVNEIELDSFYKRVLDGSINLCHDIRALKSWRNTNITSDKLSVHLAARGRKVAYIFAIFFDANSYNPNSLKATRGCVVYLNQFIEKIENSITIRKQLKTIRKNRDELLQRANIKESFFANVSHEIRTPLNIILGIIQSLEKKDIDQQLKNMVLLMKGSAENLLFLINDILDLSKIQNQSFTISPKKQSIRSICKELLASFQYRKTQNLQFNTYVDPRIPSELLFDGVRLKQVFNNLISNSFKFTRQGYIDLYIIQKSRHDDKIELMIILVDTGKGIHKDNLHSIFDPYTQDSVEHQFTGTGLGLNITHKITELMGGKISIDSVLDAGTKVTIEITFPFDPKHQNSIIDETNNEQLICSSKIKENIRSLIVDDNHINIFVFKELLDTNHVGAKEAYSGSEAIEIANEFVFDIIFMDINMPQMGGVETARRIRQSGLNKKTPIIAFTAHATKSEIEQLTNTYFNDILTKPVIRQKLIKILNKYTPAQEVLNLQAEETNLNLEENLILNVASGLMTCQSNIPLYRKLLLIFIEDNADFKKNIEKIFLEKGTDSARHMEFISHKLCGTCSNLGLDKLNEIMRAVNIQLKNPHFNLDELLHGQDEMLNVFDKTLEKIHNYLDNKYN